jgi:hypothetical protein
MRTRTTTPIPGLLTLIALAGALMAPATVHAANYPLELAMPRAANTSPASGMPAISPNHRIFWAYPGLEYNIRPVVVGGLYPYTFSISNAPAGMTIDARTGLIRWPSPPSSGSVTPTITVRDSENTTVSSPWTITVDASRFIFLDSVNGREFDAANPGTGTISNPFRRIRDLYSGSVYASKTISTHVNKIAYFRTGTYFIDGYIEDANPSGGYAGRMAVLDTAKPVAWIAYPGETATIDGQCTGVSPQIGTRPCNYGVHIAMYGNGNNTYIDALRFRNMSVHAFRTAGTGNYQVFRRNQMNLLGPTLPGVNEGFITTITSGSQQMGAYLTIQDNVFENIDRGSCVKLYTTQRTLIEDNVCRNVYDSVGNDSEGFALKGGPLFRITVRNNNIYDIDQKGIGGNMNQLQSAELLYNRISNARLNALDINQDGLAGPVWVYRNTIVGQAKVRNTDTTDGPFYFQNNVIINSDPGSHIVVEGSTPSRVIGSNNLVGAASGGIVDGNLNLTSAYASYVGTHGYQTSGSTGGGGTAPSTPQNVRIVSP